MGTATEMRVVIGDLDATGVSGFWPLVTTEILFDPYFLSGKSYLDMLCPVDNWQLGLMSMELGQELGLISTSHIKTFTEKLHTIAVQVTKVKRKVSKLRFRKDVKDMKKQLLQEIRNNYSQ